MQYGTKSANYLLTTVTCININNNLSNGMVHRAFSLNMFCMTNDIGPRPNLVSAYASVYTVIYAAVRKRRAAFLHSLGFLR